MKNPTFTIGKDESVAAVSVVPLEDRRISWQAKGVMALLLTRNSKLFFMDKLLQFGDGGVAEIKDIIEELERVGYVKRVDTGATDGDWYYSVSAIPPTQEEAEKEEPPTPLPEKSPKPGPKKKVKDAAKPMKMGPRKFKNEYYNTFLEKSIGFNRFWQRYPNPSNKKQAAWKWFELDLDMYTQPVLERLERDMKLWKDRKLDKVPHAGTYLNNNDFFEPLKKEAEVDFSLDGDIYEQYKKLKQLLKRIEMIEHACEHEEGYEPSDADERLVAAKDKIAAEFDDIKKKHEKEMGNIPF